MWKYLSLLFSSLKTFLHASCHSWNGPHPKQLNSIDVQSNFILNYWRYSVLLYVVKLFYFILYSMFSKKTKPPKNVTCSVLNSFLIFLEKANKLMCCFQLRILLIHNKLILKEKKCILILNMLGLRHSVTLRFPLERLKCVSGEKILW